MYTKESYGVIIIPILTISPRLNGRNWPCYDWVTETNNLFI